MQSLHIYFLFYFLPGPQELFQLIRKFDGKIVIGVHHRLLPKTF